MEGVFTNTKRQVLCLLLIIMLPSNLVILLYVLSFFLIHLIVEWTQAGSVRLNLNM
jgi:hypothetical protein